MPVITALGLRWQIASDFIPILAAWGLLSHAVWFLIVGILFLISEPAHCAKADGRNAQLYESVVDGTLSMFAATMLVEVVLMYIGLQGTPFEESRRKAMIPALYFRMLMWVLQTIFNVYATVVVEAPTTPTCYNYHDRDVNMRVMVYLAWGFIVLNWVRVWAVYTLFPDYQDIQSWRRRARILVFGCIKDKDTKDIQNQLKQQGEKPLKRTTRVFAGLVRELDLAPTDQVVGLILLAALQRRRRGIHISTMLRPEEVPAGATLQELRAARGTSLDLTAQLEGHLERVLTGNANDLGAVLGHLRDHRETLVSALEGEPAAAASLADSGILSALQAAGMGGSEAGSAGSIQRTGSNSLPRCTFSDTQPRSQLRRSSTMPADKKGSRVSFGAALQAQDRGQPTQPTGPTHRHAASAASAAAAVSAVASSIADVVPSGASGPPAAEDTAENAEQLLKLQSAAAGSEPSGVSGTAAAAPPAAGMEAASPSAFARPSAFQAAALRSTSSMVSGSSGGEGDQPAGGSPRSDARTGNSSAAEIVDRLESKISAALDAALNSEMSVERATSVEEVTHEIARSNLSTFLTPSSIAAELRPDLDPGEAADIYTGVHQHVDQGTLWQARTFAKYATTVYGASFIEWLESRNKWYTRAKLLLRRGYNAYQANELNAEKIKTFSDHLNYEAVVQYAGIADNDLLYFSYTNQALGALPYIVVLDHDTRSVIVSVRGSVSTADWVTDFLGIPELLEEWLPDAFKEEHPDLGPCFAHSGILAAAKAVWADLEEHGILEVLLNPDDGSEGDGGNGKMDHADREDQRDQAQKWNQQRKSAAAGQETSENGAATTQQDLQSDDSPTDGANSTAHGIAGGVVSMLRRITGRSEAGSAVAAGGSRVSPAAPRDVEIGLGGGGAAMAAENGGGSGGSMPEIGDVRGPEAGPGQERIMEDTGDLRGHQRGQYAAAIMKRGLKGQGWKLVVTGHSLGAGVAALLSLKLRHSFPDTKCWAFCPPGGLVSANLSAAMAPFCTSVIVGKDAISRVSMSNLAGMMDEVLIALARCRQPTCKVLLSMTRRAWRQQTVDQLLFAPEEVPKEALERLHRYQAKRPDLQKVLHPMLPPGRAIFMRRLKNKITAREKRQRDKAARRAAKQERKAEEKKLKRDRKAQAREAKQQEAAERRERKVEARTARRVGHHGLRASLDRGADAIRDRAAALRRAGSGALAPSAVAVMGGPEAGARGPDPDARGAGEADEAVASAAGGDARRKDHAEGAVASFDRLGGRRRSTLGSLPESRPASVTGSKDRSRVSSLDMWLPEAAVAPPPPGPSPAAAQPDHEGVRRSRDTGLLPATSADVAAGTVQATREESAGGTQLGRVTDHQTQTEDAAMLAALEAGQEALRRQLSNSAASGLTPADRTASAPTSAGALAEAGAQRYPELLNGTEAANAAAAGAEHAEQPGMANGGESVDAAVAGAGVAQQPGEPSKSGAVGSSRRRSHKRRSKQLRRQASAAAGRGDQERAAGAANAAGGKGAMRTALTAPDAAELEAAADAAVDELAPIDDESDSGSDVSVSSSNSDEEEAAAEELPPEEADKVVYERLWDAVWVHPQEVIDEGILISPRMTSDHYTTSLVGALQAVLTGGRETGTLEQQAGGAEPVQPHAPVDRLRSIVLNRSASQLSYRPSGSRTSGARQSGSAGADEAAAAADPSVAGTDIGGGGYRPSRAAPSARARSRVSSFAGDFAGRIHRAWSGGSGSGTSHHGGEPIHAVRDLIPG